MKKILSVSYKDDTPAFKSEQFFNDLKNGSRTLHTKYGPMKVSLRPEDVYCFIFWTKNPSDHFIQHLGDIKSPFYIQWTITGYDRDMEENIPDKDTVMQRFIKVSKMVGSERIIWRYDPILINGKYTVGEHVKRFVHMSDVLAPYTRKCVISFMDEYGKIADNIKAGEMRAPTLDEIHAISREFSSYAECCGLTVRTCGEGKYDLSRYGIEEGACIDAELIEKLTGETLPTALKTPNSFRRCRCAVNTDIGSYHTCKHGCKYCYAK